MSNKRNLTSNAAQVNHFGELYEIVKTYGLAYNPSNENLSIAKLETYYASGITCIQQVLDAEAAYSNLSSLSTELYDGLNKKLTRMLGILKSVGVKDSFYEDVFLVVRQIYPVSKKSKSKKEDGETTPRNHVIHLTPERKVNELSKILELLDTLPNYQPNETELSKAGLKALYNELEQCNNKMREASASLNIARLNRDKVLYNEVDGLATLGKMIKNYVRGVFGPRSAQAKQVAPFRFRQVKNI